METTPEFKQTDYGASLESKDRPISSYMITKQNFRRLITPKTEQ